MCTMRGQSQSTPPALSPPASPAGACGGETACSTCHIIVDPAFFSKLPKATDSEEDMLDLAAGLTKTSRLGCQVRRRPSNARWPV